MSISKYIYFIAAIIDSLRADVECGCLKDCNDIKYSLQTSETMFWFHNSRVSWTLLQSKVIYKREMIHGFVEALILTGASLSLFIGMSCLTIVEIFFFVYLYLMKIEWIFCIQIYSPLKKYSKNIRNFLFNKNK